MLLCIYLKHLKHQNQHGKQQKQRCYVRVRVDMKDSRRERGTYSGTSSRDVSLTDARELTEASALRGPYQHSF